MKTILLCLAILISCQSCSKTDDDTREICNANCTVLEGRFVTHNNMPLKDIKLRLDYRISAAPFGSSTRIIREARTDENGFYKMEFFVEENEIGEDARGYFTLLVDASNLNPEDYIRQNEIYVGDAIYSLATRDTIIDKSFYIPTKDFITVTLTGFSPIDEDDFFEVRTLFPSGLNIGQNDFLGGEYQTGSTGYGHYTATSQSQTFNNVVVAKNELNVIRLARRKDATTNHEDIEIFIPENNTLELNYEY